MRDRVALAVLAAATATALVTAGTAHAGTTHASTGTAKSRPRVVDVTSMAQIPTVQSNLKGKAVPNQVYRLTMTNNDRGECLDGDTNTIPANGAKVQLWACNGWTNQTWIWAPAAGQPAGNYTIQNADGSECLDGDTNTIPANGAKVQLWACNGWTNQTWAWHGSTLTNNDRGECLDGDTNTIPANGAKVQLWACNGWTNQNWTLH
ncbi:RICIN domain-containing protein [Streptantibioticus rubrisoli]|uniref:RICIN domain-containing protein n=1 Tax=Streptantibioticus rubrisoli TaxID=1387313 RepID=A0ABT1P613_9ACTN|nr:RICIN domain-containing protein [Streptantibioticus rubrisoli]MCQ4040810.1 RICIN domain-containing protein [Streptantibioticus rubrisoli]